MATLLPTFKALADPTRLRLVRVLQAGPFGVNELAGILGSGQSRVSRHLKTLADAGLVESRREGSWVYYSLSLRWREGPDAELLGPAGRALAREIEDDGGAIAACFAERRERAETFFHGVAARWDARRDEVTGPPLHVGRLAEIVREADIVVDLGTGTGVLLPALAPRAQRVIGIDASAPMLRVAEDNARAAGLGNVELRLGAVEHLPLPDGAADVVVANMVLHHVAAPPAALAEVHRALRDGGRLVVADFRPHEHEDYRESLGDLWLGFEPETLERWLAGVGLETVSREDLPSDPGRPTVQILTARKPVRASNRPADAKDYGTHDR